MNNYKKPLLFALCLVPIALIAGIFVTIYQLGIYGEDIIAEVVAELGSMDALVVIGAVQCVGYAFFCGFFGHILSEKLGLWKPICLEKRNLLVTLAIGIVGGIIFSFDYWVFGNMIDGIQSANTASLTVSGVVASVLYGGIIEEVMLRLFFMSLIAFVIWKVFSKKSDSENIPTYVFVAANIVAALVFAAGHLPATSLIFGKLTPLILFRCFLLNGGFGLIFGWLYRKHGVVYAMLGHALFHIISKLIWFIFI